MPVSKSKSSSKQGAPVKSRRQPVLQVLSSKTMYQGKVFHITSDKVVEPSGVTATREVVRHSGSVVILPVENGRDPRILLERQYRYSARDYMWELPAGRIDPGEKALAAGQRELLEETGYRARRWKKFLFYYPSPGFLDETMTVFLAEGLTPGDAQPEDDEKIDYELLPLSQALEMIAKGKIRDGKTIASLAWLACRHSGRKSSQLFLKK